MVESTEQVVVAALEVALRDHGWLAASDPARLRATLSDLLGAHADEHRGALDAIVVSAEEGVPDDLRSAGRSGAVLRRSDLVARLVDWGIAPDRAAWVVGAWESLVPESTLESPVTAPPEPGPTPEPPTELPPAEPEATGLPPLSPASLPPTSLPPTSLPAAVPATRLPPTEAGKPKVRERTRERAPTKEQSAQAESKRYGRWPWVAGAAALVVLAGAGVAVALNGDGGQTGTAPEPTSSPTPTGSPAPTLPTLATGRLVASQAARPPAAPARVAMAGRLGGVRVKAFGEIGSVGTGADKRVAKDDAHLVGFTLADGPCASGSCRGWKSLPLRVAIDGRQRALPEGGPTFVVAAAQDADVELVYRDSGFDQRVSLLTGEATGENIEILLRSDRATQAIQTKMMDVTASGTTAFINNLDRSTTVSGAQLYFFETGNQHPQRPDRAYLHVDLTYARPGSDACTTSSPCAFTEGVVTFESGGTDLPPPGHRPRRRPGEAGVRGAGGPEGRDARP